MRRNRARHVGAAGFVVAAGLAATTGAESAPGGSRFNGDAAQTSSQIAFVRAAHVGRRTNYEIHVMKADGSEHRRLARRAWLETPSWSPDGRKIAFYRIREGIFVVNAEGTGQ